MSIMSIERRFRVIEKRELDLDAKYGRPSTAKSKQHIYIQDIKNDVKRDAQVYGMLLSSPHVLMASLRRFPQI
jgi:hypothetical protein